MLMLYMLTQHPMMPKLWGTGRAGTSRGTHAGTADTPLAVQSLSSTQQAPIKTSFSCITSLNCHAELLLQINIPAWPPK